MTQRSKQQIHRQTHHSVRLRPSSAFPRSTQHQRQSTAGQGLQRHLPPAPERGRTVLQGDADAIQFLQPTSEPTHEDEQSSGLLVRHDGRPLQRFRASDLASRLAQHESLRELTPVFELFLRQAIPVTVRHPSRQGSPHASRPL